MNLSSSYDPASYENLFPSDESENNQTNKNSRKQKKTEETGRYHGINQFHFPTKVK